MKDHDSVLPQVQDYIVEKLEKASYFRKRISKDYELNTYLLSLVIDRSSGFIKSIVKDDDLMSLFVNGKGQGHALEKNTDLLRMQILSPDEFTLCQRISHNNSKLGFVTIKLFNQFRSQLYCSGHKAEQMIIPIC